jgi:hypothetical protein
MKIAAFADGSRDVRRRQGSGYSALSHYSDIASHLWRKSHIPGGVFARFVPGFAP